MARITDVVEQIIKEMIEKNDGFVEITRAKLADQVNCVPSQITYVLATRFTNDHGFLVESRRGGGGSIRIYRVNQETPTGYLMHALNALSERMSQHQADVLIRNFLDYEIINPNEARLLRAAMSDRALSLIDLDKREEVRVDLLKNMLTSLIVD